MEETVYMSIRLLAATYILYKVWRQKSKIRELCDLLYTPPPRDKPIEATSVDENDVIGATRFVYLDENAGKGVAPYMSQSLEIESNYLGEEEVVSPDEVECNLPIETMRLLQEEQEMWEEPGDDVEVFTDAVTPSDLLNAGDVLFNLNGAGLDEEKSRRAAQTLHAIRETDMFEIITSQVENKGTIEELMRRYLDGEGGRLVEKKRAGLDWRTLIQ